MVFVINIISYICDRMSKRCRKCIGSGTYVGFMGVRISTKGRKYFLKKNQNAPRPSEHPPVSVKMSKRLGEIIGCKYKTLRGIQTGSPIVV